MPTGGSTGPKQTEYRSVGLWMARDSGAGQGTEHGSFSRASEVDLRPFSLIDPSSYLRHLNSPQVLYLFSFFCFAFFVGIWVSCDPAQCMWFLIVLHLIVLYSINSWDSNEVRSTFATSSPHFCATCSQLNILLLLLLLVLWSLLRPRLFACASQDCPSHRHWQMRKAEYGQMREAEYGQMRKAGHW